MRQSLTPLTLALLLAALPGLRAVCLDTCLTSPAQGDRDAEAAHAPGNCHEEAAAGGSPAPAPSVPTSDDCRHGDASSTPVVRAATKKAAAEDVPVAAYLTTTAWTPVRAELLTHCGLKPRVDVGATPASVTSPLRI